MELKTWNVVGGWVGFDSLNSSSGLRIYYYSPNN